MTNPDQQVAEAARYLALLRAAAPPDTLLDVRHRTGARRFGQLFLHQSDQRAAWRVVTLGQRTDVYVGVAARVRPRGRREDVAATALLWADCDDPTSLERARTLRPTILIASGRPSHAHAYWALTQPLDPDALEHANRRLAQTLGADPRCADAARILRPPGTLNHKSVDPTPVHLLDHTGLRHDPGELLAAINAHDPRPLPASIPQPPDQDPLQQIPPRHYVRLLTGREPNREGKIACPFHEDRTPSLHAYPTPERGWTCFGCTSPDGKALGGDIYTLASRLWGIPASGASFFDLRRRLDDVFAIHRDQPLTTRPDDRRELVPAIER